MKILYGAVWRRYVYDNRQIKKVSDKNEDLSIQFEKERFDDLLKKLPSNWEPDIVLFESPEYNTIPLGIESSPYPTVAIVGDWNLCFINIRDNLKRFDWIVTDKAGVKVFQQAGYENVDYFPMYGFDPSIHHRIEGIERTLDVAIIGNFNHNVQRERSKWLKRIAKLNKKYKIKILTGIYGEDYAKILNQAKIVFNRSIKGEMNKRAFEAPACGTLLFFEEANLGIREFLEPGKECILYNDQNLEDLIEFYLTHEKKREPIAEAGYQKIQQFTFDWRMEKLLSLLKKRGLFYKNNHFRTFHTLPVSTQYYQSSLLALKKISKDRFQICEEMLQRAISENITNFEAKNTISLLYLFIWKKTEEQDKKKDIFDKAIEILNNLAQEVPNAALVHYNLGYICQHVLRFDLAEAEYLQAIQAINSYTPFICKDFILPRTYDAFRVEWERIAFSCVNRPEDEEKAFKNLLLWRCSDLLGDICSEELRFRCNEAINWYKQAISARPDLSGTTHFKLGQIYTLYCRYEEAIEEYQKSLAEEPFLTKSWKKLAELHYQLGNHRECENLCQEYLSIIDACPYYSNELSWINPLYKNIMQEQLKQ